MKFLPTGYQRVGKLVAVVSLLATGCGTVSSTGSATSTSAKVSTSTIGLIVPTTGPLASGGAQIVAGSQAAASVWNETHPGSKATISICNDQGTGSGALQCVYKLQGSVSAFAGPDFATDYPGALPALQSSGKLVVTLSQEAQPTSSSTIFVAQPSVGDAVNAIMDNLRSQGYKNVGILVDQEPGGVEATADAIAYGHLHNMTIESASFPDSATTAVPEMQQLLSASPQALLVWSIGNAGQTVLKAISSLNVTLPVVMNYFNVSPALFAHAELPTGNKVGVLASVQFLGSGSKVQGSKSTSLFEKAYTSIIHQPPSWAGSVGGNAVDVIMAAEQAAGPTTTKMANYLETNSKTISGPAVDMTFSTSNHITKVPRSQWAIIHYNIQDGEWVAGN